MSDSSSQLEHPDDSSQYTSLDNDEREVFEDEDAVKEFKNQVNHCLKVMQYSVQAFGEHIHETACIGIQMLLTAEVESFKAYKSSLTALLKKREEDLAEKLKKRLEERIKLTFSELDKFQFKTLRLDISDREQITATACILAFDPDANSVTKTIAVAESGEYHLMTATHAELFARLILYKWLIAGVDTEVLERSIKECGSDKVSKQDSKDIRDSSILEQVYKPDKKLLKKSIIKREEDVMRELYEHVYSIFDHASRLIKARYFELYATFVIDAIFAVNQTHFKDACFCLRNLVKQKITTRSGTVSDRFILKKIDRLERFNHICEFPLEIRRKSAKKLLNEFLGNKKATLKDVNFDQKCTFVLQQQKPFPGMDKQVEVVKGRKMTMRELVIRYTLSKAFEQQRGAIGMDFAGFIAKSLKEFKDMPRKKKVLFALKMSGSILKIGVKAINPFASEDSASMENGTENDDEQTASYLIK